MDTIFEQDNIMMTFINGFEKGEPDYILAIDVPAKYFKAKFEKNEEDNFVLKFTNSTDDNFDAEYFFKMPAALRAPGYLDIILMNSDAISFSQSLGDPQEIEVVYKSFSTEVDPSLWAKSKHCAYYKYSKKDFRFSHLALQYDLTTHKDHNKSWNNAIALNVSSQNVILVSFDETLPGDDAYCREKQLKKWHRDWKKKIISDFNPEWKDLTEDIGVDEEYIQAVTEVYEYGIYKAGN